MKILHFIILIMAIWRLSSLIAREDGLFDVFGKIRVMLGVRYDKHGFPYGSTHISEGLICMWCNSIWLGILFAITYHFYPDITIALSFPFALSTGALVMERIIDGTG